MFKPARKNSYRGTPYWEREKPEEVLTDKVVLSYYQQTGKLQISLLWTDKGTGEKKRGKTVVIDQEDLALHKEAAELIKQAIGDWNGT